MKHLDLFSGIGGFALAARNVGWETVGFCEIDPYCQKVLAKHWPGVPIHSDIRTFNGIECDIITGGFPCQDISGAGLKAGIAGERSGLWSEFARLIRDIRPRFALVENVSALLDRGHGKVLGDLAEMGYDAEWDSLPASSVGAPHVRERIWILAYPASERRPEVVSREATVRHATESRWSAGNVDSRSGAAERLSELECLHSESAILGVDDGIPNRVDRLRGLGNAIVPQVAEVIFRAIMESEQ